MNHENSVVQFFEDIKFIYDKNPRAFWSSLVGSSAILLSLLACSQPSEQVKMECGDPMSPAVTTDPHAAEMVYTALQEESVNGDKSLKIYRRLTAIGGETNESWSDLVSMVDVSVQANGVLSKIKFDDCGNRVAVTTITGAPSLGNAESLQVERTGNDIRMVYDNMDPDPGDGTLSTIVKFESVRVEDQTLCVLSGGKLGQYENVDCEWYPWRNGWLTGNPKP